MSTPSYPPNPDDPDSPRPAGGPPRYVPSGEQYGAGPYGADQYGADQYGGGRPADVAPPPDVQKLLTLTLVSAAIYLISQVLTLIAGPDLAQLSEQMGLSAEEATQVEAVFTVVTVGLLVVAAAIYGLIYVFLKKGRNWARVLGIVLAALSVVSSLASFFGTSAYGQSGLVTLLLGIVFAVVNVLWLVTAFKAPVKAWCAPRFSR